MHISEVVGAFDTCERGYRVKAIKTKKYFPDVPSV